MMAGYGGRRLGWRTASRSGRSRRWGAWLAVGLVVGVLGRWPATAQQERRWAVVVGVDRYQRGDLIPELNCAVNDARALAKVLQEVGGFRADDVFLLTSDAQDDNRRATKSNIAYWLDWIRDKAQQDDVVVFYFAGHGTTREGKGFLLTQDADPRSLLSLEASSVEVAWVQRVLGEVKARKVLLFMDACRNEPVKTAADRAGEAEGLTETFARNLVVRPKVTGADAVVATFFACSLGQKSYEWRARQHGFFTYYLIEGLRGAAADAAGRVTPASLGEYLTRQVPEVVEREMRQPQIPWPQKDGPGEYRLVLASRAGAVVEELPTVGRLTVTSEPAGATLWVGEGMVRKTPCEIEIDLGGEESRQVEVTLALEGYRTRRARVELRAGQLVRWEAGALEKLPEESLPAVTPLPGGGPPAPTPSIARRGDLLIVYERELAPQGDVDLFARVLGADGRLIGEEEMPVATGRWAEQFPILVPAAQGGAYLLFSGRALEGDYKDDLDMAAQWLSMEGRPIWNQGERPVIFASSPQWERGAVAVPHPRQGFLAFFEMFFPAGDYQNDSDLAGQRVSWEGQSLWHQGERSVILSATPWRETHVAAVPDGQGGAFVFCDQTEPDGKDIDIAGQHLDEDGQPLWGDKKENKAIDIAAESWIERKPVATPDGQGGCYLVYEAVTHNEETGRPDVDLFVQRFSAEGQGLWNEGNPLLIASSTRGDEQNAVISADEQGLLVIYEFSFTEGEFAGDTDLVALRLSPDGQLLWGPADRDAPASSMERLERAVTLCADGEGGWYLVFESEIREGEFKGDIDLYAQRLSGDGRLLWEVPQAVATSGWHERSARLVPHPDGGFTVVFEATDPQSQDTDVWAQSLDPQGKMRWEEGVRSVRVSETTQPEQHPAVLLW